MNKNIKALCDNVMSIINADYELSKFIDNKYEIPDTYTGTGEIKLIILGQDPTIKNPNKRKNITTVLNLDKSGELKSYLSQLCARLGVNLAENVYATNLLKNFFTDPPVSLDKLYKTDIIQKYSEIWIDVLMKELSYYPEVPVLILGEPLLKVLANDNQSKYVKYYWGYTSEWKNGTFEPFDYIKESQNKIHRLLIPFPHQPSIRKGFYRNQFDAYCDYINNRNLIK